MPENRDDKVLSAVKEASSKWRNAFNSGDAAGCAAQYEVNAVMHARPFGTFNGTEAIQAFWQQLIDDGYNDVDYIEPKFEVIDDSSAVLTSGWKMNKAGRVLNDDCRASLGVSGINFNSYQQENHCVHETIFVYSTKSAGRMRTAIANSDGRDVCEI